MKKRAGVLFIVVNFILFFNNLHIKAEKIKFIKKYELGSEEKKEEIFFKIQDVKADRKGNIFILDYGNNCIKKFSKERKFLKEAGRKGQGPGEMMNPLSLTIDENRNVYVSESLNNRLNIYDNNLNFINTIKFPSSRPMYIYINSHETLIGLQVPRIIGDKYFIKFSKEGKLIQSFFDEFHPYAPRMKSLGNILEHIWAFQYLIGKANLSQHKKRIAFTYERPENPYKIYLLDTGGKVIRTIEKKIKDFNPQDLYEFFKASYKDKNKRYNKDFKSLGIVGLHFTKEDFLISQINEWYTQEGHSENKGYFLDIFSPEGDLVEEGIRFADKILSIDRENNVYSLREDEEGIQKVIVYSLKINK
ncbi:MAG: 6-bladed beta-propeller [Acidobacteriota bacterium]